MGKTNKWKKRQGDAENGDESTESCDENVKSACPHVAKAVDLTRLKKALKIGGFEKECAECLKSTKTEVSDPDFVEDLSLWMCLRCGSQLCGRARNQHALNHFNRPHSDSHALTANTTTWAIYCYNCNDEVTATSSKKLHECIEYLKKQAVSGNSTKSLPPIELPPPETILKTEYNFKGKDKAMGFSAQRVRGLSNLGNTCFFNSVMQCLVQTPYLLPVLQEMSAAGEQFTLPGGKLNMKLDGEEKEVELPPITGQLSEWGVLTRTLAETLADLQTGEGGVYTPRKLLSALVNKLPQFGGGDQHDAHELLRHLLEAVRSEDLRRYQSVILSSLGINSKVDPSKVDGESKQKVKFYGQQASDTMLRPEQVFRGFLVSTLECQECFSHSDRAEYFLDLSLPVAASRPQPPAVSRRKTPNEESTYTQYNDQEENKPSKHQLKKERIAARKAVRKNKGCSTLNNIYSSKEATPESSAKKEDGKSSSEQSDADVEDNLEDGPRRVDTHTTSVGTQAIAHTAANFAHYLNMESGYNSEKVISSDSIRTSPVHLAEKETPEENGKVEYVDSSTSTTTVPLEYKPLTPFENLSNPDSGVASPEATKHNSTETVDHVDSPTDNKELGSPSSLSSEINLELTEQSPVAEPERPVSRIDFAPEYTNKVMSRGISVKGSRQLLEQSGDSSYESPPDAKPAESSELTNHVEVTNKLDKLKLGIEEKSLIVPPAPPALPAPLPRPTLGGADDKGLMDFLSYSRNNSRHVCDEDECSVASCLSQFTALELLTGNNKVGCDTCTKREGRDGKDGPTRTVYTNATKRFLVASAPAILILHLKRFQLGPRCMFRKMSKHVDFPAILDLAPFSAMDKLRKQPGVNRTQDQVLYSLYGVVEHSGGMHGGHYVAYVKVRPPLRRDHPRWGFLPKSSNVPPTQEAQEPQSPDSESELSGYESGDAATPLADSPPGKWYYVSDSMVSEISEDKVLRAQAYLLFYERIL